MSLHVQGYPATRPVNDDLKAWLEKKSEEMEKEIHLVWGGGNQHTERPDGIDDNDLVIFDFASSIPLTARNYDHVYFQTPEFDGAPEHPGDRIGWLYLTVSRACLQMRQNMPEQSQKELINLSAGNNNSSQFEVWQNTIWSTFALNNIIPGSCAGNTTVVSQWLQSDNDHAFSVFLDGVIKKACEDEYWTNREKFIREEIEREFIEYAQKTSETKVTQVELRVQEREAELARLSQQMTQVEVQLKEHLRDLEHASTIKETDDEVVRSQISSMWRNANIIGASFIKDQKTLVINLKELYMYSPDRTERVKAGQFDMQFNLAQRSIRLVNNSNKKRGRHHPHVPESGIPCWGAIDVVVRNMLRDIEISSLIDVTISYLETYNPADSWGIWASWWFRGDDIEYRQEDGSYQKKSEQTMDILSAEADALLDMAQEA